MGKTMPFRSKSAREISVGIMAAGGADFIQGALFLADQWQNVAAENNHLIELRPTGEDKLRNTRPLVFDECRGDFLRVADYGDCRAAVGPDRARPKPGGRPFAARH